MIKSQREVLQRACDLAPYQAPRVQAWTITRRVAGIGSAVPKVIKFRTPLETVTLWWKSFNTVGVTAVRVDHYEAQGYRPDKSIGADWVTLTLDVWAV
jgi:hypothetical protein